MKLFKEMVKSPSDFLFKPQNLELPHYFISDENLTELTGGMKFNKDPLDFYDLHLPHEKFLLSVPEKYMESDKKTKGTLSYNLYMYEEKEDCLKISFWHKTGLGNFDSNFGYIFIELELCREYEIIDGKKSNIRNMTTNMFESPLPKEDVIKAIQEFNQDNLSYHLTRFNYLLSVKNIAQGVEQRVVMGRKTNKKKAPKNITVIHFKSRETIKQEAPNPNIEWSHSWKVRGHWRYLENIESLGKNRHGERFEQGRTWVTPHDKQIDLAPINKTRIFECV